MLHRSLSGMAMQHIATGTQSLVHEATGIKRQDHRPLDHEATGIKRQDHIPLVHEATGIKR